MRNIDLLADKFEDSLEKKAARGRKKPSKKKRTRRQIIKDLDLQKRKYQDERKRLSDLEKKRDRLEKSISDCRDTMRSSRSNMLNYTDVLKNMDLADCSHVMFYDNDEQDVAYLIDGNEHHISSGQDGDLEFMPFKEYLLERKRKAREEKRQSDQNEPNDLEAEESDAHDAEDDLLAADDGLFGDWTGNFRFFE